MKRLLLLFAVIISISAVCFAAVTEEQNIDVSFIIDTDSANFREFGFSETEVTASSRDVTPVEGGSLLLKDNVNDLNLIATGNVYAYWKVNHAGSFTIELSGSPLVSDRGDSLHWHGYWTDKGVTIRGNSDREFHTNQNAEETILVYTHSPYSIGTFSIDSVPISIMTSNGASLIPGRYRGTLTLSITDGG